MAEQPGLFSTPWLLWLLATSGLLSFAGSLLAYHRAKVRLKEQRSELDFRQQHFLMSVEAVFSRCPPPECRMCQHLVSLPLCETREQAHQHLEDLNHRLNRDIKSYETRGFLFYADWAEDVLSSVCEGTIWKFDADVGLVALGMSAYSELPRVYDKLQLARAGHRCLAWLRTTNSENHLASEAIRKLLPVLLAKGTALSSDLVRQYVRILESHASHGDPLKGRLLEAAYYALPAITGIPSSDLLSILSASFPADPKTWEKFGASWYNAVEDYLARTSAGLNSIDREKLLRFLSEAEFRFPHESKPRQQLEVWTSRLHESKAAPRKVDLQLDAGIAKSRRRAETLAVEALEEFTDGKIVGAANLYRQALDLQPSLAFDKRFLHLRSVLQ